ncbi:MAG TPA: L,D-transpeptidase, partial [Gaiellaceae bacterium]|nr:L,D-transpeptidase [Gaiellaceae bacterium]
PLLPYLVAMAAIISAAAASAAAASSAASQSQPTYYPRVGLISSSQLVARSAPSSNAHGITIFHQFRPDYLPTVLLAVGEQRDKAGRLWLKVSAPGRPNGRYGWVRAEFVDTVPIYKKVVVDLSSRTLSVYDHGRLRYRTRVAIGTHRNPTPKGNFYIQARFKPTDKILGRFAFETSAYSPTLTEWPGGGIIGIHGWNDPSVLGKAVSHGCIRVSNTAALNLSRQLVSGTPVTIRA